MDVDISNLSEKARKRLHGHAIHKSSSVKSLVLLLVLMFLPGLCAETAKMTGFNEMAVFWTALIISGLSAFLLIRKWNLAGLEKFISRVAEQGRFPLCFECKTKLDGVEGDACPKCGADIRVRLVPEEKNPRLPESLRGRCSKHFRQAVLFMLVGMPFYMLLVVILILSMQCGFLKERSASDSFLLARSRALSHYGSGGARYYEAKPGNGYEAKTDRTIDGIPVWEKYYNEKNHAWMFPFLASEKKEAEAFVDEYNERMRSLVSGKARVVRLSEENDVTCRSCGEHWHGTFKAKFMFGDVVTFDSKVNGSGEGRVVDIIVSDKGDVSYNIALTDEPGTVAGGILPDEMRLKAGKGSFGKVQE